MFCFGILGIFGGNHKKRKTGKLGIYGLLRCSVGNSRRGVDLCQGMGYLCHGKAEVPKWHPLGTPWRSKAMLRQRSTPWRSTATPWHSYCSQRTNFFILFLNTSYSYTDSLRTLIND